MRLGIPAALIGAILLLGSGICGAAPAGGTPPPGGAAPAERATMPAERTPAPTGQAAAPADSPALPAEGKAAAGASPATSAPAATPAEGQPAAAGASEAPSAADTRALDEQTQQLKKDVVDLNRDLYVLEEELLYPANTQVAVFLSMDVGSFFALDSVQLKIDQKEVANYLYTPREVDALMKGGVQRLYVGNLKTGSHELVAFFTGKGPNGRDYKRGASVRFDKSIGAHYLELKINDRQHRLQPEFEIKDWGE